MPTTHAWNGASGAYLLDPARYTDGASFAAGDTLVVNNGHPSVASTNGTVAPLATGTYQFAPPGGGTAGLDTDNVELDAASVFATTGPGTFQWLLFDQFVNDGAIQVGSSAAPGTLQASLSAIKPATLTNRGAIAVLNNSLFRLQPSTASGAVVNAAGATLSVGGGGTLSLSSYNGYSAAGIGNINTTNNGILTVTGAAGRATSADFEGSYGGTGLLSVRGAPGAAASGASAEIAGPASGIFDVASGQLRFHTTPVGGVVNFLDGNAALVIDRGAGTSYGTPGFPFGAVIRGFQAGDVVNLNGPVAVAASAYDPVSHLLTLSAADGSQLAQFNFAGAYAKGDFRVTPVGLGGAQGVNITTTSTAEAVPAFAYTNTATGAAGSNAGSAYDGPVSYLQSQYIWASQDAVAVRAGGPDVFIKGGAGNDAISANSGSNVLDGGAGSNFLTGATGTDGGRDTFFLDGTAGTTWDTVANFHPGDSVTLWGFVPGKSAIAWADNEGAAGHAGATLHAAFGGAGTPPNGSVTFTGVSLADSQSRFTVTPGSVGGRSYLSIHFNS